MVCSSLPLWHVPSLPWLRFPPLSRRTHRHLRPLRSHCRPPPPHHHHQPSSKEKAKGSTGKTSKLGIPAGTGSFLGACRPPCRFLSDQVYFFLFFNIFCQHYLSDPKHHLFKKYTYILSLPDGGSTSRETLRVIGGLLVVVVGLKKPTRLSKEI